MVVTTSLTLLVVIMSQSAATARTSADEIGVADDLSRDFVGVGLANVAAGRLDLAQPPMIAAWGRRPS